MATRSFIRDSDNKLCDWSYNAEGGYITFGSFKTGSKKETLNSIVLCLGTGKGHFFAGTNLYGSGNKIEDVSLKLSGSVSESVYITNSVSANSSGYPDTSTSGDPWNYYTFKFNNVTLSANTTYSVQIKTPTTSSGSTGLVLCLNNRRGDSINYTEYQDTFTVTYNANGGSNPPSKQTGTLPITLSSSEPSRTNCEFDSWNTKSDGSGDSYKSGSIYNKSADVTLYAIWKYLITYNGNGGQYNNQTSIADGYIKHGQSYKVKQYDFYVKPSDPDDEPDETIKNYRINNKSTGDMIDFNDTVTIKQVTTFYAQYSTKQFTVEFQDGWSGKVLKAQVVAAGENATPPSNPTRLGYTFTGWLGNYKNVRSDSVVKACWGSSPVWVRKNNEWVSYQPEED